MENIDSQENHKEEKSSKTCGLVMPISAIDGMPAEHWAEVRSIIHQVATGAGFETSIVSSATVSGLLPARIVTNLYKNDIVICDVSGRNPNVMFELGLRLAFDKPTIIIKDDATEYTFDIQSIGHLEYPRSLRITKMEVFKDELSKTIKETYQRKIEDPTYSTFLKHYKIFEAKGLETNSDLQEFVSNGFESLSREINSLKNFKSSKTVTANIKALDLYKMADKTVDAISLTSGKSRDEIFKNLTLLKEIKMTFFKQLMAMGIIASFEDIELAFDDLLPF